MVRLILLGSGSSGNALYCEARGYSFLLDAGLSPRQIEGRMRSIGARPENLRAILLSHEHGDHVRGAIPFSKRHGIPLWMNAGTSQALPDWEGDAGEREVFVTGRPFPLGPFEVRAFPTPHDAREPVGFLIAFGRTRMGVAVDIGAVTLDLVAELSGLDCLILEANHDRRLLEEGPYPPLVKARIAGPLGHLANDEAAALLAQVHHRGLRRVVLAHLSEVNNRPDRARAAVAGVLDGSRISLGIASRGRPTPVLES